jgi:hypothetical protein
MGPNRRAQTAVAVICRVCGIRFAASRSHAITCTPTCRQRLHRGEAFAYFAGLSINQRHAEREYHAERDHLIASRRAKEPG